MKASTELFEAVAQARRELLRRYPFLASIVLQQEVCIQDDIPERTIATSGKKLIINPQFFISLSPVDQVYVLAHCAWHCALLHFWRRGDRDKALWDMASDIEVSNLLLNENGMDYPSQLKDGLCQMAEDFEGMSAEEIYDELASRKRLKIQKSRIDQHLDEHPQLPYYGISSSSMEEWHRTKASPQTTMELKHNTSIDGEKMASDYKQGVADGNKHQSEKKADDEENIECTDNANGDNHDGGKADGDKASSGNENPNGVNPRCCGENSRAGGEKGKNASDDKSSDETNDGGGENSKAGGKSDDGNVSSDDAKKVDASGKPEMSAEGDANELSENQDGDEESDAQSSGGVGDNASSTFEGLDDAYEVIAMIQNAVEDSKRLSSSKMGLAAGNVPGCVEKLLESLRPPSQNWRVFLGDYVKKCHAEQRRWYPSSRRHIWRGVYLPSIRSERLNAVVAIDTSGSTCTYVERFFSEMLGIVRSVCSQYEITLIECDYEIQNVQQLTEFSPTDTSRKWKVHGLGGTSFVPVFDYVKDKFITPDVLIFFTDGCGEAPDEAPDYPVIWCLPDVEYITIPCNWGKEIRIPVDSLNP